MSLKPNRLGLTKIQSRQTISTSKNWRETKKKKRSTSQTNSLKSNQIKITNKLHNNRKLHKITEKTQKIAAAMEVVSGELHGAWVLRAGK